MELIKKDKLTKKVIWKHKKSLASLKMKSVMSINKCQTIHFLNLFE